MHFYDVDGRSKHTIVGKNGKERTTSIKDARELNLFPGVTSVTNTGLSEGLVNWYLDQLLNACLTIPFHPEEFEEDQWKSLVLHRFYKEKEKPSQLGKEVHNAFEHYFKTGKVKKGYLKYMSKTLALIEKTFPNKKWIAEDSFSHANGYGGCVDLHCDDVIIDFKVKSTSKLTNSLMYDEYKMQLVAYKHGLLLPDHARLFDIFISAAEGHEGDCLLVELTDHYKYWCMFSYLLQYWKLKHKHDPKK